MGSERQRQPLRDYKGSAMRICEEHRLGGMSLDAGDCVGCVLDEYRKVCRQVDETARVFKQERDALADMLHRTIEYMGGKSEPGDPDGEGLHDRATQLLRETCGSESV